MVTPVDDLRVVADPQRWELLSLLGESDRRVGDLVALTGKAQNLVSYHLGQLASAGLVSSRRSSADGRDSYYRLNLERYGALVGGAASALHPGLRLIATEPASPIRPPGRRKRRVLFLCTGNSARSQIAEALLLSHSAGRVGAASAGSHPKALHPSAVRVLAARGIDISGKRTKHLDTVAGTTFDRVVTLCDKVKEVCPDFPGEPVAAHWSIADPAVDGTDAAFEATTEDIDGRVRMLLAQLSNESNESNEKEPRHARRPR